MAKKKIIWYRICKSDYDLRVGEVEVAKVTESRVYFPEASPGTMNWNRQFANKDGSYEMYFPTREEAVAEKLKRLERAVTSREENLKAAKKLLAEFKAQENL